MMEVIKGDLGFSPHSNMFLLRKILPTSLQEAFPLLNSNRFIIFGYMALIGYTSPIAIGRMLRYRVLMSPIKKIVSCMFTHDCSSDENTLPFHISDFSSLIKVIGVLEKVLLFVVKLKHRQTDTVNKAKLMLLFSMQRKEFPCELQYLSNRPKEIFHLELLPLDCLLTIKDCYELMVEFRILVFINTRSNILFCLENITI